MKEPLADEERLILEELVKMSGGVIGMMMDRAALTERQSQALEVLTAKGYVALTAFGFTVVALPSGARTATA